MKKCLHFVVILVLSLFVTSVSAQNLGYVLEEDFEKGIPTTWTQEKVFGDFSWTVESGNLKYPNGTAKGTKRVAFRNETRQTTGAITRLISPVMDLSEVFQPILCFAHAQDKWTGDFDTLRVYYRTSESGRWIELKKFDQHIARWQRDTIYLTSVTKTYQIAFEATDNLGHGIVLDDVVVRSAPNCAQPFNLMITNVKNQGATLSWIASFDASELYLKVSTTPLTAAQLNDKSFKADAINATIDGAEIEYQMKGLVQGTKYYVYLQSNCDGELSEWSEVVEFTTTTSLELPYYQNFNMKYQPGVVSYLPYWVAVCGEFDGLTDYEPFINTFSSPADCYAFSPDATASLFFMGSRSTNSDIPAGKWNYIASPEVVVDNINTIQVSFWTTRYNSTQGSLVQQIIVGVMTDPSDKSTFVAVDTVVVSSYRVFEEFIVRLDSYKGEGKHIAFMSDFDVPNKFIMDDLRIEAIPTTDKAQIKATLPAASTIKVNFIDQSEKYEVVVLKEKLTKTDVLDTLSTVVKREVFTVAPCLVEGLDNLTLYYVYARHINGDEKGRWSNACQVRTQDLVKTLPYKMTFDIDINNDSTFYHSDADKAYRISNDVLFKSNRLTPPYLDNNGDLFITANRVGDYNYVIFPEVDKKEGVRVELEARTEFLATGYFGIIEVGLATDAMDESTYQFERTIELTAEAKKYKLDLETFKGEGNFLVIKVDDRGLKAFMENDVRISEVLFTDAPDCIEPAEFTTEELSPTSVKLTWDAGAVTSWNVRLSKTRVSTTNLNNPDYTNFDTALVALTNSVVFENLESGSVTYYYYVQPICGEAVGFWSVEGSFKTGCRLVENLPYVQNFDDAKYAVGNTVSPFGVPCMFSTLSEIETTGENGPMFIYYPYLTSEQSVSGNNSLYMAASADTADMYSAYASYVAFPKFNTESVSKLQISMKLRAASRGDKLEVGVMTDPNDIKTFELVGDITLPRVNQWVDYYVTLDSYKGKGEYIALRMAKAASPMSMFVDDVRIENIIECNVPQNFASDAADVTAKLSWKGAQEKTWRLVVATSNSLTEEALDAAVAGTNGVAFAGDVTSNPYTLTGLATQTTYYWWVKSVCNEQSSSDWSDVNTFTTMCELRTAGEMGVEDFEAWTYGKVGECFVSGNSVANASSSYKPGRPTGNASWPTTGKSMIQFYSTTAYNGAYLIFPPIDVDDISRLRVKFDAATGLSATGTNYSTPQYAQALSVGIITDVNDFSTYTEVATVNVAKELNTFSVNFDTYTGDYNRVKGKRVVFISKFDKDNRVYLDNVEFDTIPECVPPTVVVDSVTTSKIYLTLNGVGATTKVRYVVNGESDTIVTNNNKAVIENLKMAASCDIYASTLCEGEEYSAWSNVIRVSTGCEPTVAVPFSEDFDANPTAGAYYQPACWYTHYTVEGKETQYPHVYASGYSGKGAYVYCNGDGQVSYLVSRELLVDSLNRCQVSFMAKGNGAGKAIIVGVVEDPSSPAQIMATFEPIDTIKPGNSAYEKVLILLSGYKGGAKHVAFKSDYLANGSSTGGVYIDNVSVELIPICAKPDVFSLISWKDTELTFSFKHDGAAKYEVEYGPKDFTQGTGTVVEYTNIINQFVLSGLTASTNYDIYMRAICSETDASIWSFVGNYTTTQTPINQFPYTNGFEDAKENALWQFVQSTQKNNHWYIDTAYVKDGEKALYVSNDGGVTATYEKGTSGSWAYRAIDLKEGSYVFSMDWVGEGTAGYDFMRIVLLPITATFSEAIVTFEDGTKVNNGSFTTQVLPAPGIDLTPYVSSKAQYNGATEWTSTEVAFIVTEEMAQYYNLAVYWRGSNYTSTDTKTPSMIVDNISIKKITCPTPFDVKAIDVSDSTAIITWDYLGDAPESYNVKVLNTNVAVDQLNSVEATSVVYSGNNLAEAKISLTDLKESTEYYIYVQSSCSADEQSFWSDAIAFKTPCKAIAPDENGRYFYGFEDSEGLVNGISGSSYKIPSCFVNGGLIKSLSSSNNPYAYKNSTNVFARTGNYALRFTGGSSNAGGYIAFPAIEGDIKDMQVKFQMRATHHVAKTGAIPTTSNGLAATYGRKIIVGTMGNPNEPSSFVAIDTIEYMYGEELGGKIATQDSTLYWQEVKIPLEAAQGRYLAFVNGDFGKTNNQMYVDDVIIEPADKCITPYGISVTELKSTTATLTCNYDSTALGCVVVLSTSEDLTENVVEKTVTEFPYTIEGLTPATRYYVRMQQLCRTEEGAEIVSDWSEKINFVTPYQYRLNEEFETTRFVPEFWMRATSPDVATVFETQAPLNYLPDANSLVCWKTRTGMHETGMFSTGHIQSTIKATSLGTSDWLITPSIELEKDKKQHLLFELALTDIGTNYPFNPSGGTNADDKFYVIVSEDNGATWTNANATLWDNSGFADYELNTIPATGERYRVDLSKYAGKVIKIAFYLESVELNFELDMHLDNVYINSYVEETVPVAICQTEDFYYNDFFVSSDDIKVGENEFSHPKYMKSVTDTMYAFNITMTPMSEKLIEATICEGDVYALNGFRELTKAGVYKQKIPSANDCDSVVTLNLTVTPIAQEMVFDTICFGAKYSWNGKEYDKSGSYTETLESKVTGCDSIVTLMLKVNDALASTESVEICFGQSYIFGGDTITESGEYTETFVTASGCDSIVTLIATVLPDYRKTYNEVICAGETFTGYGFNEVSRSGSYPLKLQSVGGCDSTITLNLTVLSGDTTRVEQTISESDLPYEYQGKVYPIGTKPGVYVDTINVSTENCDNVIILTLTIEEVVGVDNIAITDLTMVPNPVRVAEELVVVGEFTELERQGLVVTVFNALGQKVYEAEPDIYPIVVDGLYQRGVYVVRVITGLGGVYQGKVIVE